MTLLWLILILLPFTPWFLRRKGYPNAAKWIKRYGFLSLIGLIIIEQSFLYFYLDPKSINQTHVHKRYIEEIKNKPGGLRYLKYEDRCQKKRIALIYTYQICTRESRGIKGAYLVFLFEPEGYLKLLRQEEILRRKGLFLVSNDGEILKYYSNKGGG